MALFEDEATVKTLRRKDGHVWLMPENPEYQPIDGDGAQLLGKVVAVIRRYDDMRPHIDHVELTVSDLSRAERFYDALLPLAGF